MATVSKKNRFDFEDIAADNFTVSATSDRDIVNSVIKSTTDRTYGEVPVDLLHPNPFQPRKEFTDQDLDELAASIKENGLIEAIIIRPSLTYSNEYDIVCGERRWRATSQKLHWTHIRAEILGQCTDSQMKKIALIENIQRKDLHPFEVAHAYQDLLNSTDAKGRPYTVRGLALELGKGKDHVQLYKDLLSVPSDVKQLLLDDPKFPVRLATELADLDPQDRAYLIQEYRDREIKTTQMLAVVQERKRQQPTKGATAPNDAAASAPRESEQKTAQSEVTDAEKVSTPPSVSNDGIQKEEVAKRPQPSPDMALLTIKQRLQMEGAQIEKMLKKLTPVLQSLELEDRKQVVNDVQQLVEAHVKKWNETMVLLAALDTP